MSFEVIDANAIGDIIFGVNVVLVKQESDFGVAVGGKITLREDCTYALCNPVTVTNTLVVKDVNFTDLSQSNYLLTSTAAVAFEATELVRLQFLDIIIAGDTTNKFVDLTGVGEPSEIVMVRAAAALFNDLGNIDNSSLISCNIASYLFYDIGFSITDGGIVNFESVEWDSNDNQNSTAVSLDGTFTNIINFLANDFDVRTSGNSALNFDSAITAEKIVVQISQIDTTTGSTFLKSGSIDETDPRSRFFGNGNEPDSEVFGEFTMLNNSTETVITAQNTPVIIGGTTTVGNTQRFTHTNGRLTYIGLENITVRVQAVARAMIVAENEGDQYTVSLFKNGIESSDSLDTQILGTALANPNTLFVPFSLLALSTNDFIEVFVTNNTTSNENILFESLKLVAGK